jgi:hypothetical protein
MYENDLANLNNWTGIVEDYDDPLKTGRLRVRINGFHNINKTVLPTTDLPWAMVALPVNGSTTFMGPKIGDWVIGFFFDGESAQLPVVTHVLPGINTVVVKQPVGAPRMPVGEIYDRPGRPSLPPLGRGVVQYTAIDKSNRNRAHVCDISYEVNQTVTALKIVFGPLFDALRAAINLVIGGSCLDPTGFVKMALDLARQVTQFIKEVTSELNEIQKTLDEWTKVAEYVAAMITYIRSLPEQAAIFFRDCISQLVGILKRGIQDLFAELAGDVGDGGFGEIVGVINDGVAAVTDLTKTTAKLLATPQKIAAIVLTPTSTADAENAVAGIKQLVSDAGPISSPLDVGAGP